MTFRIGFRTHGEVNIEGRQIPLSSGLYDQTPIVYLSDRFDIPGLYYGYFPNNGEQRIASELEDRYGTRFVGRFKSGGLIAFTEVTPFILADGQLVVLKDLR